MIYGEFKTILAIVIFISIIILTIPNAMVDRKDEYENYSIYKPLYNTNEGFYNNLDEIPQQIYDEIKDYVERYKDNCILILDISAGLGKTYVTSQNTSDLIPDLTPYIYFTLNHQIAKMFVNFKTLVFGDNSCEHIKGKSYVKKKIKQFCMDLGKDCVNCSKTIECEKFLLVCAINKGDCKKCSDRTACSLFRECKDQKGFDFLIKYGRNDSYCKKPNKTNLGYQCPDYYSCPHRLLVASLINEDQPKNFAGHFLHYPTLYKQIVQKKWKRYDFLKIFDEDMSNSFIVQEGFSIHRLNEAINNVKNPKIKRFFEITKEAYEQINQYQYKRQGDNDVREFHEGFYMKLILALVQDLDDKKNKDLKKEQKQYDKALVKSFGTATEYQFNNPINFLIEFKEFVDNYGYKKSYTSDEIDDFEINNDIHTDIQIGAEKIDGFISVNQKFIIFDFFRLINEFGNTIILNATYENEIFKRLIPPNANLRIKKITGKFSHQQKIYALKGKDHIERYATYPIKSLLDRKRRKYTDKYYELVEKARFFAKRHDKTAIFCVKKLVKETRRMFSAEIQAGTIAVDSFSWAIGNNDYKNYNACVILHTPFHNLTHFRKMVKMYDINELILMKNETINKIIQAIFRIRPLTYDPKNQKECEILIFSSVKLNDLEFEEGCGIDRFWLKDFYRKFDPDYITNLGKNILKYVDKNRFCKQADIVNQKISSMKTTLKELDLLIEKGYMGFMLNKKEGSKGRPSKVYYSRKNQERKEFLEFQKAKK